jgi:hypothetical protein
MKRTTTKFEGKIKFKGCFKILNGWYENRGGKIGEKNKKQTHYLIVKGLSRYFNHHPESIHLSIVHAIQNLCIMFMRLHIFLKFCIWKIYLLPLMELESNKIIKSKNTPHLKGKFF